MPKLPVLSSDDVIKVLRKFGFRVHRQTGCHIHLLNEERRLLVTVPNNRELAKGTLISIMKQAKVERDEFISKIK